MDIENPHPRDLWLRSSTDQVHIINGYKARIMGARLAFPNAQLGLYGTLNPDPEGYDMVAPFPARFDALHTAAQSHGLFNDIEWDVEKWDAEPPELGCTNGFCPGLDYLMPILYIRFGCNASGCEGDANHGFQRIGEYTEDGIEFSQLLHEDLPVLPILNVRVRNDNSDLDQHLLRDLQWPGYDPNKPFEKTLSLQMKKFAQATTPVPDVVLWVEDVNDLVELFGDEQDPPQPSQWKVDDYTCSM